MIGLIGKERHLGCIPNLTLAASFALLTTGHKQRSARRPVHSPYGIRTSSLCAAGRTKISSFNPPLPSVGTTYPTQPQLTVFEQNRRHNAASTAQPKPRRIKDRTSWFSPH